jgi:excisionase family DNA binding protein
VNALLKIAQVADRLSLSRSAVYLLVERGELACYRVGPHRGAIRVSEEQLGAYLKGRREGGSELPPSAPLPQKITLKHLQL